MIRTVLRAVSTRLPGALAILVLLTAAGPAQGETVWIDQFEDTGATYLFPAGENSNSVSHQRTDSNNIIIGEECTVTMFVDGLSGPTSLAAAIYNVDHDTDPNDGEFLFAGARPGGSVTFDYGGTGNDALDRDLRNVGEVGVFRMDLLFLDTGPFDPDPNDPQFEFRITLTSPNGTATFQENLPETSVSVFYERSLADFDQSGSFDFEHVDAIQVAFNEGNLADADFAIDRLRFFYDPNDLAPNDTVPSVGGPPPGSTNSPEPASGILAALAALGAAMPRRRRRRR